jgi:hypothetical protein
VTGASALTGEAELLAEACAGEVARARMATRTCDGRLFAAAGVNLKSPSADAPPLRRAASRGSAVAGVNVIIGCALKAMRGARGFESAASAGDSKSPATPRVAATLVALERRKLRTFELPVRQAYIGRAS